MEKLKQTPEENYGTMSPDEYKALLAATEAMLAAEGMPAELESTQAGLEREGYKTVGFEVEKDAVRDMQNHHDDEIDNENLWGDPVDKRDGLPPCLALKKFREDQHGPELQTKDDDSDR